MVIGLVVALLGVVLALRAHIRIRPALAGIPDDAPVDDVADVLERVARAFRATDRGIRSGVAMAVVGLLVAGLGAYLVSGTRALGADVGGSGTDDNARVGGSW